MNGLPFKIILSLFLTYGLLNGAGLDSGLTFEGVIRPILKAHCFSCHGEGEILKGGVDLRLRHFLADTKTENGSVLVPGKPELSLILRQVQSGDMPKGERKLADKDIATIAAWIVAGAPTLSEEPKDLPKGFQLTDQERKFWAFQPIRAAIVPRPGLQEWARTPIDAFILKKLAEQELHPADEASKAQLIRRVYFDLLGLPPTPDQVDRFVADESPQAYERLVDNLLESPRYGERWGRHWLDVAGYADSNGYAEADSPRPHAWRYRDYVIRAMNADKPWNQFLLEQLAGDELAEVTQENAVAKALDGRVQELLAATGFLRMAPDGTGDDVGDQNLARNQVVAETIKIVSSSLMGLSVGCAQCHDHRYDPISQVDYYRMRSLFEPALDWKSWRTPGNRLVSLYSVEDRQTAETIEASARQIDESAEQLRKAFLEIVFEKELAKLPEELRKGVQSARNTSRDKRSPEQVALLKRNPSADVQGALDLYDPEASKKVLAKQAEAAKVRATKPTEDFVSALTEQAGKIPETVLFHRGDHDQPKQKIEPGEFEILRQAVNSAGLTFSNKPTQLSSSGRRLAFGRWLTLGQHPLTARVLVNRFWLHHFGRGLVNSPTDFGQQGERPTHPELLDWLASEFMASGWRLKPLHRLILNSAVYRQSSSNQASLRIDSDNRYYGRMTLRRFDAETLRDSILWVSGKINYERFGPPVPIARDDAGRVVTGQQKTNGNGDPTLVEDIGERAFRRTVYGEVRRSFPLTILDTFDEPVMSPNCAVRQESTVAPQALMMLNDPFVVQQSRYFAERLKTESPNDLRTQVGQAWRWVYGVEPLEHELESGLSYLTDQTVQIRSKTLPLSPSSQVVPGKPETLRTEADSQTEALASLCQALISANRFLYVE